MALSTDRALDDGLSPTARAPADEPAPTPADAVVVPTSEYRRLLRDVRVAQDGLAEAQNRFQRLVETIPGVAYIAEPGEDGVWQYISSRLVELLGYEPSEWLTDSTAWIGLTHPEDRERVLADEGEWIERTGGVHVGEYRILARSGEYRWIRDAATARPGQGPDDKALRFGVLSDVTESREAQAASLRNEQRPHAGAAGRGRGSRTPRAARSVVPVGLRPRPGLPARPPPRRR